MKTLIVILSCLPLITSGQAYLAESIGMTNGLTDNATITSGLGTNIDCRRYSEVAVQVSYALSGAGTSASTWNLVASLDNTNWPAAAQWSLTLTPNGTNTVCTNLTINTGSAGYLKLLSVNSGDNSGSYPTNVLFLRTFKPNRREGW